MYSYEKLGTLSFGQKITLWNFRKVRERELWSKCTLPLGFQQLLDTLFQFRLGLPALQVILSCVFNLATQLMLLEANRSHSRDVKPEVISGQLRMAQLRAVELLGSSSGVGGDLG